MVSWNNKYLQLEMYETLDKNCIKTLDEMVFHLIPWLTINSYALKTGGENTILQQPRA